MAKLDVLHVPHNGAPLCATELIATQVDVVFAGRPSVPPHS
jgi:tripartite-type tricarboxylate transporter receptor subunit TctC